MKKIIIAAVAKNNVIGRSSGEMPWYSKAEFVHFRKTTLGYPVIMGRKTFESLGKPLEDRLNIVLTKKVKLKEKFEELVIHKNLEDAFEFCESKKIRKVFIIGGGKVFKEAITKIDAIVISHMNFKAEGDVLFPKIELAEWRIKKKLRHKDFNIVTYTRISGAK